MRVEVVTPEEYMGDIIGDLNIGGNVSGMDQRGDYDPGNGSTSKALCQHVDDEPRNSILCISIITSVPASCCRRSDSQTV